MMNPGWHLNWYATETEALDYARFIWHTSWGVEIRRVNKANRLYDSGFTVRWKDRDVRKPTTGKKAVR